MADGIAVLQPDGSDVRGVVRFDEMFDESGKSVIGVHIKYRITGLTDGEHGFHIHRYGDLTDGCTSACEHFDPRAEELETEIASLDAALDRDMFFRQSSREYSIRIRNHRAQILENRHHGSLKSPVRHFGDLGNIKSKGGVSEGGLFLAKACLRDDQGDWRVTKRRHSILGRMIIVHADRDDLGKGGLKKGEIIDEAVHQESLKTGNAGKRLACGVIGLADPDTDTMTMDAEDDWAAEDHTIDDLDDESLMIRMENLAERMDAIVQRIGSYPDAERDPEYLRLVEQHTAYARVLARRHGFGAEDDDEELYYIRLRPKFAMGYVHHHRAFSNLEDAQSAARILSLEFPAKHRGVLGITEGKGYPPKFMLTKSSCRMCGADSENPCVCMIGPEVRPCADKPITKWQSDSVMYQPCLCSGVTDGEFEAESDPVFAFRYMPESAYHRALENGYMEPHGYHGATLATLDPTPTSYQTDGWYGGGNPLSDIYQIDLTGLQYRHHQVSAPQGQVILIEGDIPVDQIQPISWSYSSAGDGYRIGSAWESESDPVSSVAAGTTDAFNDFANSHDTDDKFYFIGGLVGGLAIAVLGNIISDRLQDVYFPHWWDNRGGSSS